MWLQIAVGLGVLAFMVAITLFVLWYTSDRVPETKPLSHRELRRERWKQELLEWEKEFWGHQSTPRTGPQYFGDSYNVSSSIEPRVWSGIVQQEFEKKLQSYHQPRAHELRDMRWEAEMREFFESTLRPRLMRRPYNYAGLGAEVRKKRMKELTEESIERASQRFAVTMRRK